MAYLSSLEPSVQQRRGVRDKTGHYPRADAAKTKAPLHKNTNNLDNRHPEIVGPILSTSSASRHPRSENIPFLLARLVGKRQETWPFLEPRFLSPSLSVRILVINREWGGDDPTFVLFFTSRHHMTHRQSFLAPVGHKPWPPSFLAGLA